MPNEGLEKKNNKILLLLLTIMTNIIYILRWIGYLEILRCKETL